MGKKGKDAPPETVEAGVFGGFNEGRNTNIRVDLCRECRTIYIKQLPSVFFLISEQLLFGKKTTNQLCNMYE